MTPQEFVTKYNGKAIDFDGWYGNQCVDLMNQYLVEVCGISSPIQTFPGDTAYNIFKAATDPRFDKILNTPDGVPQPGDIVFWNTTAGSAGHVAVYLTGDANVFTSFDQNWPVGSVCHEQKHDYSGVAGWLHFRQQEDTQQTIDDLRKARDDNWNLYQTEVIKNNELVTENQGLKTQISQVNQADASLLDNYKKKLEEDATAIDAGLKAEQERQQLWDQLHVSTTKDALESIVALQKPHQEVVKQVVPLINKLADAAIYKRVPKPKTILDWFKSLFQRR